MQFVSCNIARAKSISPPCHHKAVSKDKKTFFFSPKSVASRDFASNLNSFAHVGISYISLFLLSPRVSHLLVPQLAAHPCQTYKVDIFQSLWSLCVCVFVKNITVYRTPDLPLKSYNTILALKPVQPHISAPD